MRVRLLRIARVVDNEPSRRVLLVIGTDPVIQASGRGVTHDQLISGYANAENAVGPDAGEAPVLDKEALLAAKPDVILLLLPNELPLQPLDQDRRLTLFRGLNIPAVVNKRIVLLSDPLILLPSSSLAKITAQMAKAIHPEKAKEIDQVMNAPLISPTTTFPAVNPGAGTIPGAGPAENPVSKP
jgi:ABC-type Fe3+-hydroxamate transport system substrate-binding protein